MSCDASAPCACSSFVGPHLAQLHTSDRCQACKGCESWGALHAAAAAAATTSATSPADCGVQQLDEATGNTALHVAAAHGCAEAAELFLAHGAAVDACNAFGCTPLHSLAHSPASPGALSTLLVLAAAGADLAARTTPVQGVAGEAVLGDETALHLAAQHSTAEAGPQAAAFVHGLLNAPAAAAPAGGGGLDPLEPAGPCMASPLQLACAAGGEVLHAASTHLAAAVRQLSTATTYLHCTAVP